MMVVNADKSNSNNYPSASLLCRPNSHPFQDRSFSLATSVKVGRSVARARPAVNNAIFDCKVLSRNHALFWYENGKFYIQDTKSSNGTFVNNQRLSKGAEESAPRELCSGDILQFGVDVMENSRKVTHGCIIATLKLYLPDGKEAKASPIIQLCSSPQHQQFPQNRSQIPLHTQDLYQLNQYIQEALVREQLLETKLAVLQRLVGQTETATEETWKSMIDEDRLLTRVEILESQLSTYGKNVSEDKLRDEIRRLMDEKERYQDTAKATLKKLVDEKLAEIKKVKEIEKLLSNTEDEYSTLKELYDKDILENQRLSQRVTELTDELEIYRAKFKEEVNIEQLKRQLLEQPKRDNEEMQRLNELLRDKEEALGSLEKRRNDLENLLLNKLNVNPDLLDELLNTEEINLELKSKEITDEEEKEERKRQEAAEREEIRKLEENLARAEEKISKLILLKEKYVDLSSAKRLLETDNGELKKQLELVTYQSRTATLCSTVSIGVLILAVIIAFLPYFTSFFGTAEKIA